MTGQRFGRLRVDHLARNEQGKPLWSCVCDCGNEHETTRQCLARGITRSCGCLRSELLAAKMVGNHLGDKFTAETSRARALPFGEASRRDLLGMYKHNAQGRGLAWELTDEQFTWLTQQPCLYCGDRPHQVHKRGYNGEYTFTGIDRSNNLVGYLFDNCVPCCTRCNRWKFTMSKEEFLSHAKKIIEHLEAKKIAAVGGE